MARSIRAATNTPRDWPARRARLRPHRRALPVSSSCSGILGPRFDRREPRRRRRRNRHLRPVGAKYGYDLLWVLVVITVTLAVVQEMAARMGAVTGKGLAELIREQYGVRWATFSTVRCSWRTSGSASASSSASAQPWSPRIRSRSSVPVAGLAVWLLVVRGSYKSGRAGLRADDDPVLRLSDRGDPRASEVGRCRPGDVAPHVQLTSAYLFLFVATAGTTITPFMKLYLQSAVVERGIGPDELPEERAEVVAARSSQTSSPASSSSRPVRRSTSTAITSSTTQPTPLRALAPFAGRFAEGGSSPFGLLGASLLAAAILPVTAAYVIAETFGFEKGISRRPREAPVFVGVLTALIVVGTAVAAACRGSR